MDLLTELVNMIGLNKTFFLQFVLATVVYFISKKLVFQPYLESFEKRQKMTKGRVTESRGMEQKIEEKKELYKIQAKKIHEQFQARFNVFKSETEKNYLEESLKLKLEQKNFLIEERQKLNQEINKQEESLQKDFSCLIKLLVEKIKS